MFDIYSITGWTVQEAEAKLRDEGFRMRVIREDGQDFAVTMDLRKDRVNVEIDGGKIAKVHDIG